MYSQIITLVTYIEIGLETKCGAQYYFNRVVFSSSATSTEYVRGQAHRIGYEVLKSKTGIEK